MYNISLSEKIENLKHYNISELLEILGICDDDIEDGNFRYNNKEDLILKCLVYYDEIVI